MKGVRFEPLASGHIAQILEIEKVSHGSPWHERSFQNELSHAHSVFVVALKGTDVVGYAGVWILADEAHVTTIAVQPELRGQGLGRELMDEVLARSAERGAVCSTLEVRAGNEAAIHLYESMGYVRAGLRKGYYPDNKEDAVVMWLHQLEKK
ncbi:MAG: ribosomal protein S18-alanine N-acetyltransferase [Armatimonadetes bacterium]|nr:ribosomal protein S18-alanine N-acetyltransferase [Armatimonadota bacterium]